MCADSGGFPSCLRRVGYSDADTMCDCGEKTQTMDHLLKCHMLSQECTTEDLMEYNEDAKECVTY